MIGLRENQYVTESHLFITETPTWLDDPISEDRAPRNSANTCRRKPPIDCTSYRAAVLREELHSSMRLVHDAYVRLGLIRPNQFGLHVIPYHLLQTTEVLIAARAQDVLATMTIVGDSEYGLPLESLYQEEVATFRRQGLSVAEVSCLADKRERDDQTASSLFRLMALTAQRSRYAGIDLLLAVVHPRHAKFYERFLGFELFGAEKPYEKVCGAPAVGLVLDLPGLRQHSSRAYKRLFGEPFPSMAMEYHSVPEHILAELAMILEETHRSQETQWAPAQACQ